MSTDNAKRRYRKDLSEMPDWLKKKACPHRDKFMSGKRILPKNITGKEKLADLIDDDLPRLQRRPPQGRPASSSPRRCSAPTSPSA